MKALRIVLVLLTVLGATVARADVKLADEGYSFPVPTDLTVRMCTVAGVCGPTLLVPAQATNRHCGEGFVRAASPDKQACMSVTTPVPPAAPVPFTSCYPEIDVKLTWAGWVSTNYKYGDVPASVGARKPYLGWWIDCTTHQYTGQYFDWADITNLAAAAAKQLFGSSNAINAWVAAQPIEFYAQVELDYYKHTLEVLNQQVALPPVMSYVVQPVSSTVVGDRPVYRLKADGTRNTTAVSGKRAIGNTPCGTKALGSYRDIPSLKDATGDVYAVCVAK